MKSPPTLINRSLRRVAYWRSGGFTLIEIIVGIAIIAIVSTLGMAGWQGFSRYQAEAEFNNLETSFRAERANSPANFPSTGTAPPQWSGQATTVERMINGHKKVFYITEFGAILTHLPNE